MNPLAGSIFSFRGRRIGPKLHDFPSFREMFYGLSNIPRFGGQAEAPAQWNVLKHSACVALLCGKRGSMPFIRGMFHDYPEMWIGDVPTPFKTDEIRAFEEACMLHLAGQMERAWSGFNAAAYVETEFFEEDRTMLAVEAAMSLKVDDVTLHEEFHRNKVDAKTWEDGCRLFYALHRWPNDLLVNSLAEFMTTVLSIPGGPGAKHVHDSIVKLGASLQRRSF